MRFKRELHSSSKTSLIGEQRRREPSFSFRRQAAANGAVETVQFGLVKAARFEPGLERTLGLVVPSGAGRRVLRRQPGGLDMGQVAAVRPACQRQPGRKNRGVSMGYRRSATILFFFNLHVCLIVWGCTSNMSASYISPTLSGVGRFLK